ncbi:MAG: FAD-binding protein [Candidatus Pacearchaeota archaeon]|jgi:D-lactate dehydrogenase (cytochrome)
MNKKEMICYCTDASRIIGRVDKVVFPTTIKEVQESIRLSNLDIVPRGAGSGLVGGVVPRDSLVVDMSKMNNVLEFNSGRRLVKVEAGITLRELNEKLNARGFEFPIDVSNEGISTIGGMIATNATGDRSMKYGAMKDWVEETEFVNGKGEVIRTSKADLGDVCGMEGITGIIVSAKLRIAPMIKRTASIFQTDNLDELLSVARRLKQEREVVKLKFFSRYTSKLLGLPEKYNLIIEFDSDRGKITGSEYEKLFQKERRVYYNLASEGYYLREDPKFFFDKIKEFILFLEEMNIPYFGHLGSGVIHPFFKDSERMSRDRVRDFIKKSQGKLGKYGIGVMRRNFLDNFEITLIQRVKLRHDPNGKLNKGKVIDEISSAKRYGMTPGVAEKISEIKPSAGEERSANLLIESMKTEESPDLKMEEFIKEVSKEDEKIIENLQEVKKVEGFGRDITSEREEIKERLKDYKETFESELPEEKRKLIESFARTIPREIVKTESLLSPVQKSPEKIMEDERIKMKEKAAVDYKLINSIMNNQVKRSDSSNTPSSSGSINSPANKFVNRGEVSVNDNLDRFVKKSDSGSNVKTGSNDKDIISKIMTNRFGKGFGTNSSENKSEEKK